MARTIEAIASEIKTTFVNNPTLRNLYKLTDAWNSQTDPNGVQFYNDNFSVASFETILIYIVATLTAAIENMFDWHKEDVNRIVNSERFGSVGWYRNMALKFRYGENLNPDYFDENGAFAESDVYPEGDGSPDQELVKYAYVQDYNNAVQVKIATIDDNNELAQLTTNQINCFTAYMNRVKPAGITLEIVNAPADKLKLELKIIYNPLVMSSNGSLISDNGRDPVREAIGNYLLSLDFNGEFVSMNLIDEIQQAEGVVVAEVVSAQARRYDSDYTDIDMRYIPYSGYLNLDNLQINLIANDRV